MSYRQRSRSRQSRNRSLSQKKRKIVQEGLAEIKDGVRENRFSIRVLQVLGAFGILAALGGTGYGGYHYGGDAYNYANDRRRALSKRASAWWAGPEGVPVTASAQRKRRRFRR